jgi:transposase InsO family protein
MQFPHGIKETLKKELHLVSDHGSQPTSKRYMKEVAELGLAQVFCSYCNPKGNADTERVIRSIKEDLIWPREWSSLKELSDALKEWQKSYNEDFPHSSLGYETPVGYEHWFNASAS